MTAVHFYHLQRQPLEAVLPTLLLRSAERGWRALVKLGNEDRLRALDDHLWSFSDESFLPHGTERDGDPAGQPVFLTLDDANPNGAAVLFLADGAAIPPGVDAFARVVLLLDGRDPDAVAAGRTAWRAMKGAGHEVTYWQQDDDGRWANRA